MLDQAIFYNRYWLSLRASVDTTLAHTWVKSGESVQVHF